MSNMLRNKNKTLKQFCLYREKNTNNLPTKLPKDHTIHKFVSYIKKQKLTTINYIINTQKAKPNRFIKLIIKYYTTTNLKITTAIF